MTQPLCLTTHAAEPLRTHQTIITGVEVQGRAAIVEIVVQRGSEPPLHRYHREDVVAVVLDGELTFQLDGQRFIAGPGASVVLPKGCEHGYVLESESAHLLLVLTPAGAEACLADLHAARSHDGSTLERLVTSAAHHGIEITGPPLELSESDITP